MYGVYLEQVVFAQEEGEEPPPLPRMCVCVYTWVRVYGDTWVRVYGNTWMWVYMGICKTALVCVLGIVLQTLYVYIYTLHP